MSPHFCLVTQSHFFLNLIKIRKLPIILLKLVCWVIICVIIWTIITRNTLERNTEVESSLIVTP